MIDVSLNGASALITFELCDNSDQASQRIPYRIENRCSRVMFTFSQKHVNAWQLLPPKTATPYAWDQVGSQAASLRETLFSSTGAWMTFKQQGFLAILALVVIKNLKSP